MEFTKGLKGNGDRKVDWLLYTNCIYLEAVVR